MSCMGKPCSKVRFEFVSVDGPLTYVYTPNTGKPSTGELDAANQNYINMWTVAFVIWMGFGIVPGFSPFRGSDPACDEGCDCDLGPEVVKLKQYTYTPPAFKLKHSKISISGKFTMRVKSSAGVCTPKAGATFSMSGGKQDREFLALLPEFDGNLKPPGKNT